MIVHSAMTLWSLPREVLRMGPIGYVALGAPLSALVAAIVSLLGRRLAELRTMAGGLALVSWLTMLAAGAAYVYDANRTFLGANTVENFVAVAGACVMHSWCAVATLLVAPFVVCALACCGVHATRNRKGGIVLPWVIACASGIMVIAAALGVAVEAHERLTSVPWECVDASCRYSAIVGDGPELVDARLCVLVVGVLAAVALVIVTVRQRDVTLGKRPRVFCGIVFALGAVAFVRSIPAGRDGARPLSLRDEWAYGEDLDHVPEGGGECAFPPDGPRARIVPGARVFVDGAPTSTIDDFESILVAKSKLWVETHPGRAHPGVIHIVASRDAPARDVFAYVEAAARSGYPRPIALFTRAAPQVQTATLGVVQRTGPLCGAAIGNPPRAGTTWGEFLGDYVAAASLSLHVH